MGRLENSACRVEPAVKYSPQMIVPRTRVRSELCDTLFQSRAWSRTLPSPTPIGNMLAHDVVWCGFVRPLANCLLSSFQPLDEICFHGPTQRAIQHLPRRGEGAGEGEKVGSVACARPSAYPKLPIRPFGDGCVLIETLACMMRCDLVDATLIRRFHNRHCP